MKARTARAVSFAYFVSTPEPWLPSSEWTIGGTVAFYSFTIYTQKFLVNSVGWSRDDATLLCALALLCFLPLQPILGLLSDRIGGRPLLIAFGILGSCAVIPIFTLLGEARNPWAAGGLILAALVIVSGYTSINAIVKAELFPASVRALGVGFPYAVTVSVFGGSAEFVALWAISAGAEQIYLLRDRLHPDLPPNLSGDEKPRAGFRHLRT